jgi:hypothetical protein
MQALNHSLNTLGIQKPRLIRAIITEARTIALESNQPAKSSVTIPQLFVEQLASYSTGPPGPKQFMV